MNDSSSRFSPSHDPAVSTPLLHEPSDADLPGRADSPRCEWDLQLSSVVSSSSDSASSVSDILGAIEFDPLGTLLATGGIARKIRIYRFDNLVRVPDETASRESRVSLLDHSTACDFYLCTPAKLSSLCWRPGSSGRVIGSGDYDGVVTEYDLEKRVPLFERDEHGGRRVWTVDYSQDGLGASGSDDGKVQVWDSRCEGGTCVAVVQPGRGLSSPVCCVEFNPFDGNIMAAGCVDRKAYCYDMRNLAAPVHVLEGHGKTVTYVKFVDARTLVTASIDGCLKMWQLESSRAFRTYRGHVNSRSFVGLSVWRNGGLIGCGSEDDRVFVYDKRWGEPIWVRGFGSRGGGGFVSSVCWRQVGEERCTMVASGSDGVLQVFVGKRSSSSSTTTSSSSPSFI
ncbi:hypothetical protein MLD38_015670 [Melastoma candidum]|uniref:Uncharacterized protein n=1 Tax=Melastoma candidum TaxID=119954 RepID=A0ACB9RGS4_9MYRT|nr:hypothetical protein MLD38_015670 [Melastoma candidum]